MKSAGLRLPACGSYARRDRSALARGEVARLGAAGDHAARRREPTANPYTDVVCWIDLEGPGFARRVYGFWDGGAQLQGALRRHGAGRVALALRVEPPGRRGAERRPRAAARRRLDGRREASEPESPGLRAARPRTGTPSHTPTARLSSCSATRGSPPRPGGCRTEARGRAQRSCPDPGLELRGRGRLAQATGLQLHQLHRGFPELGRRSPRRDVRERRRRLPAQRLGEVRPLGAERGRQHRGRRDDHGEGHGRRAGQPAVRGARGARRSRRISTG